MLGDEFTPKYNTRFKWIYDINGNRHLLEQMYATRPIFKDESEPDYDISPYKEHINIGTPEDNLSRAKRRAKAKFMDYAAASPHLDMFVTMTISDQELRHDPPKALKKLINWLNNLVQRNDLAYLLTPELHKDGAIHFHALCNSSALDLVDSGTVLIPERKKPVKIATAKRLHSNPDTWHTVYNVQNWKYGFTTAMYLYGDKNAAIGYVAKYITKTLSKIGGRYFYHGGDIRKPEIQYAFLSLEAFEDVRHSFGTFPDDGTYRFATDGSIFYAQRFSIPQQI